VCENWALIQQNEKYRDRADEISEVSCQVSKKGVINISSFDRTNQQHVQAVLYFIILCVKLSLGTKYFGVVSHFLAFLRIKKKSVLLGHNVRSSVI
jgi:hypothetical protein